MNPLFLGGMAGNLIGGYLMGQRQREMQMENQELEQKKLKILMDAQKIKDAAEERRAAKEEREAGVLDQIIQMQMGKALQQRGAPADTTAAAPVMRSPGLDYGDSFGADSTSARNAAPPATPAVSIEDLVMNDPVLAVALEKRTSIPWTKVVEAKRKAMDSTREDKKFDWQQGMDLLRGQGVTYVDTVDPATGVTRKVAMPTNPALAGMRPGGIPQMGGAPPPQGAPAGLGQRPPMMGGGGGGGGMITSVPKPVREEYMQDGEKWFRIVNEHTREPWPGTAPQKIGEKEPLSGEAAGRAGMLTSSLESLMQAKAILMPGGELRQDWRKVVGAGPVPGLNAFVPGARDFDSHIENALAAKLRLETGANMPATEKTNLDKRFKPSPLDSEKLVTSKMDSLERFMRGSIEMLDPNKKYSSDAIKFTATDGKKYAWEPGKSGDTLPPAAVKALKEGVVTIFGNGKKYTLRNGQPVEVP